MRPFYALMGVSGDHFSRPFTTSWAFGPLILSFVRLLFSLYAFVVIFTTYGTQPNGIGRSFSFFTELTYWGLAFYTLVAGCHTLIYALRGRCWLDSWPRFLQALHTLFYTTVITFPFLVTIVYWALLYDGSWFSNSLDQWRDVRIPNFVPDSLSPIPGFETRTEFTDRALRVGICRHATTSHSSFGLCRFDTGPLFGTCIYHP